jgi:hypothetical protein
MQEHDPEKWVPVFGKDHAQTTAKAKWRFNLKSLRFRRGQKGFDEREK